MAKYLFRLDDIAPNMRWSRYQQVKELFDRYSVRPLLGVIPDNRDPDLLTYSSCEFGFWDHIRERQAAGWDIAMHGYQHLLTTCASGILGVHQRSEFAGLEYEVQLEKLRRAAFILGEHGVTVDAFMAPAHSFDQATLEALKAVNISRVSDGYTLYPVWRSGILMVPQQLANPRPMPWGVFTFCLHLNTMTDQQFARLAAFLARHRAEVIRFRDCKPFARSSWSQKPTELVLRVVCGSVRRWRERPWRLGIRAETL